MDEQPAQSQPEGSLPEGSRSEPGSARAPGQGPVDLAALRRSMWRWVAGMVTFVVASAVLGGMLFRVPYVALVPGSARDTEELVELSGIDGYPSDGELLLTTVRVRQRPNLWEYLWLQVDDDTDIVSEEVILGDRTPDENRELNLELMSDSKAIAIAVALEELGYEAIDADGVLVLDVVADTPAAEVLEVGDALVAINGEPLAHTADLVDLLAGAQPGDEVTLSVEQVRAEGDEVTVGTEEVTVELAAKPEDPAAAFLGIQPTDRVELVDDFDFEVDFDSGTVGGPSAGLAFSLAVLDQLTPGELTGGATVAVTGTIDVSGRVGAVGGVLQKTAAVRDLGADVFLVPAGLPEEELARIDERSGDDLEVIPVATLDEALLVLGGLGGDVDAVEEFAVANLS